MAIHVGKRRRHLPRPAGRGRPPARGRRIGYSRRCVSHMVSGRNAALVRPCDRFVGTGRARRTLIVPVGLDGTTGDPTVIALDGFHALPGFDPHPCATWAPDGRWVAFAGGGEVWVVDTQTGEIRRLPDLRPSDLEWRPGTDELAIAGDLGPNRAAHTRPRRSPSTPCPPASSANSAPSSRRTHVVARRLDVGVPGRRKRPDARNSGSSTRTAPTNDCSRTSARRITDRSRVVPDR